jgi:hypothetical protein
MDKRFVVKKFVTGARLPATVEDKGFAVDTAFNNQQFLKWCAELGEKSGNSVLPDVVWRKRLANPMFGGIHEIGLSNRSIPMHDQWTRQSQSLILSLNERGSFFMTARSIWFVA